MILLVIFLFECTIFNFKYFLFSNSIEKFPFASVLVSLIRLNDEFTLPELTSDAKNLTLTLEMGAFVDISITFPLKVLFVSFLQAKNIVKKVYNKIVINSGFEKKKNL